LFRVIEDSFYIIYCGGECPRGVIGSGAGVTSGGILFAEFDIFRDAVRSSFPRRSEMGFKVAGAWASLENTF
jgi:hypothetical protein